MAGNENWSELNASTQAYQEVILAAWTRTAQQLVAAVKNKQVAGEDVGSWRELIDMWRTVANENLLEMQRSDDYLTAQREFFRAMMKHRLHEQKLAEVACESMNLPTRGELDEVHRTVTGLRRELRALQREMADLKRCATGATATGKAGTQKKTRAGTKPRPTPTRKKPVTPKKTSQTTPRGSK